MFLYLLRVPPLFLSILNVPRQHPAHLSFLHLTFFIYSTQKKLHATSSSTGLHSALFVWLISHQPAVLFSQNKPAISNQPTILFSQNKSTPTISHQPNEQSFAPPSLQSFTHPANLLFSLLSIR
jgi:hypothetical protein